MLPFQSRTKSQKLFPLPGSLASLSRPGLFLLIIIILIPLLKLNSVEARNVYPLDSLYHRPEDILPSIRQRTDFNQELVSWEIIGESSTEKLPIYAFRISNPKTGNKESKPSVLFHGQHHGEEPIGVELVFNLSFYLLTEYGKNNFVTYLVDNYNLWFIPTSNPEGFRITNTGIYRLKRKNNTDTNFNGRFDVRYDGVDLNRNYPINWEKDDSDDPESPYFKGYYPACQTETQAMIEFYEREKFQLAFFYHSSASGTYSERIFFPWRWNGDTSPDYEEMLHLANTLARNLPRAHRPGRYSVQQLNTSRRSFARDYIYSQHGTLAFLIEIGGNSPYGEGVINPPNNELLRLVGQQIDAMLKLLAEFDKNLIRGRVIDESGLEFTSTQLYFAEKQHPYKEPLFTNNAGYFFYYLTPVEQPHTLYIENQQFSLQRTEAKRTSYEFKLDKSIRQPLWKQLPNRGEAIVMVNRSFQYFEPLALNETAETTSDSYTLSLLSNRKIFHREHLIERNNLYQIPWLPTDWSGVSYLTILPDQANPLLSLKNDRVKIISLWQEEEILSYAENYNRLKSFYLQPETTIGIDYSTHQLGETNYVINQVEISGNKNQRPKALELSIYSGGELLFKTTEFSENKDLIKFTLPEIAFPDDLFLTVANRGFSALSIYQELNSRFSANSRRNQILYSEWQPLDEDDLAIRITLKKSSP